MYWINCYYLLIVINKNNNNQISTEDDDSTLELEPLSEQARAEFALADESVDHGDAVTESNPICENHAESATLNSGKPLPQIQELRDELKFRDEINTVLQTGIDQQSEKCKLLTEEISGLKKTNEILNGELGKSRKKVSKLKQKLAKARDSEQALLINLKKLGEPNAANTVTTDQNGIINELRKDNLGLAETVSGLEAKLAVATDNVDRRDTQLREAIAGNTKLLDALETKTSEIGDCQGQIAALQNQSNNSDRTVPKSSPVVRPTSGALAECSWVLVSLDSIVPETFKVPDGVATIGSSPDSDIQLQSKYISGHHAQLVKTQNGCVLGDLTSTNGTFVNSRRIQKRVLRAGDTVTIGKHNFRYENRSAESVLSGSSEHESGSDSTENRR